MAGRTTNSENGAVYGAVYDSDHPALKDFLGEAR
jgi:hypothetical protein